MPATLPPLPTLTVSFHPPMMCVGTPVARTLTVSEAVPVLRLTLEVSAYR